MDSGLGSGPTPRRWRSSPFAGWRPSDERKDEPAGAPFPNIDRQERLLRKALHPGTSHPVSLVLDLLASGWTVRELLERYPGIEEADVLACIACGAETSRERYVDVPLRGLRGKLRREGSLEEMRRDR